MRKYTLDIKKVDKGVKNGLFGSVKLNGNGLPKTIHIMENEPIPFVQLLFILKECSWCQNEWCIFTEYDLKLWVFNDLHIYIENKTLFEPGFEDKLIKSIKPFLKDYCLSYI